MSVQTGLELRHDIFQRLYANVECVLKERSVLVASVLISILSMHRNLRELTPATHFVSSQVTQRVAEAKTGESDDQQARVNSRLSLYNVSWNKLMYHVIEELQKSLQAFIT